MNESHVTDQTMFLHRVLKLAVTQMQFPPPRVSSHILGMPGKSSIPDGGYILPDIQGNRISLTWLHGVELLIQNEA